MAQWTDLVAAGQDLILGSACVGCGRPGSVLCLSCGSVLQQLPSPTRPVPCPPGFPMARTVTSYDGVARAAILAHKEDAVLALARPLGRALALGVLAVVAAAPPEKSSAGVLLVCPPTTPAAIRARGHDPMRRIVAHAVRSLHASGVPARALRPLERVRAVADQSTLSAEERHANLAGAFAVRRRSERAVAGAALVVVDDVLTTGATAAETARALHAAAGLVLGVAVVAATVRTGSVAPGRAAGR